MSQWIAFLEGLGTAFLFIGIPTLGVNTPVSRSHCQKQSSSMLIETLLIAMVVVVLLFRDSF